MHFYDVWGLAAALRHINEAEAYAIKICDSSGRDEKVTEKEIQTIVFPILAIARIHAEKAHLQSTMDRVWDNGPFNMASKIGMTYQELKSELIVLRQAIEADLEKRDFVFIHPDKMKLLFEMEDDWSRIWEIIHKSKPDTKEAFYCYALERNTAAVYHSMRVAEFGLRFIAKKVGVKLKDNGKPQPIEHATWNKVIDGIKTKIAAARAMPHGPRRNRNLQFYSNAAENCTYIRDIWRNEISHTRKDFNYNEGEVLGVLIRVRDFMRFLCPPKKGKKP